ncbi:MAG: hypothetical protein NW216_14025 [Hyphomicrobium sp.]|nr:hypothetical protein [Hyphomicrobium sp.]
MQSLRVVMEAGMHFEALFPEDGQRQDIGTARLLARLPADVIASLSARQIGAIVEAARRDTTRHPVDVRASLWAPWGRFYVRLIMGPERRSEARLREEGQLDLFPSLMVLALFASVVVAALVGYLVLAYVAKSALGINLSAGPSPLHALYVYLFRGGPLP